MTSLDDTIARMNAARYVTVDCIVRRPRELSVWILVDGKMPEINIPLTALHPDDRRKIVEEGICRRMNLRVATAMARQKGLAATVDRSTAASGDLFGKG